MHRSWFLAAALGLTACDWVTLAANAVSYETLGRGAAGNVILTDSFVYATLGADGLLIHDIASGQSDTLVPAPGLESIDDIALADGLLFVLDARNPGYIATLSLDNPRRPLLVSEPSAVPVGPFSGVAARDQTVIVSGGTSSLTAWRYSARGELTGPVATTDLGRGQPDVLLASSGQAFVSTHYWGPYFGVDLVRFDARQSAVHRVARHRLEKAGFTAGGSKPSNFPLELALLDDSTVLAATARGVSRLGVRGDTLVLLETIPVGGPAVSVDASGSHAAVSVAGRHPAVVLISFVAGRGRVVRRIALRTGTKPAGVAFSNHTIVVAARDRGILIWSR